MSVNPKSLFYVATYHGGTEHHVAKTLLETLEAPNAEQETLCGQTVKVSGFVSFEGATVSPVCSKCERMAANQPKVRLFRGRDEVILKTQTELLLLAALKAVLWKHGGAGTVNSARKEFEMDRFAFTDAIGHQIGDVMIATDGNNGRDLVRLI